MFLNKIFKRKKNKNTISGILHSEIISYNDAVTIIHDATKVCWDKPPAETYNEKKIFVNKRIKTGHESILEHGNIAMLISVSDEYSDCIAELTCSKAFRYLNSEIVRDIVHNEFVWNIMIGGSIRAYKHMIRNMRNRANPIYNQILNNLYTITPREFWTDLIEDEVVLDRFVDIMTTRDDVDEDIDTNTMNYDECYRVKSTNESKIEFVNVDDLYTLYSKVQKYGFDRNDCLDMCTITIKFKEMSRVITQQLIRHRNAITQASGRYIDLSDKVKFNDPCDFKPDLNKNGHYIINLNGNDTVLTLQELGDMICGVYDQVKRAGIAKEDARGFLPQNAQCGDLYMTFTYRSLLKFLELRTHRSAQAEIRLYANIIYESLISILMESLNTTDIYKYLKPLYELNMNENYYDNIDEVIEEYEEETTNE